jgi:hypothetical protein
MAAPWSAVNLGEVHDEPELERKPLTAPAYIPIPRHPEYAGASEEAEQLHTLGDLTIISVPAI